MINYICIWISHLWNYILFSNPSDEDTEITWPAYDEDKRHYLILDYPIISHVDYSSKEVALFQPELSNYVRTESHDEL